MVTSEQRFKTRHWPAKLCNYNIPPWDFVIGSENTELLQLVQDNNLKSNQLDPADGYGKVPLRDLKNSSDYMYDYTQNITY